VNLTKDFRISVPVYSNSDLVACLFALTKKLFSAPLL
jgi:hypothetical protein